MSKPIPHPTAARPGWEVSHAGAGTALLLTYASLVPGFAPTLLLSALFGAVLVLPVLVLGAAAAVLIGPPYGIWRLVQGARRRRSASVGGVEPAAQGAPAHERDPAVRSKPVAHA